MEIKDLAGLSEPLKKLVETISNAIGKLYEPTHIKRIAKAESFKRDLELKDKLKEINEISNVVEKKEIVNINYYTDNVSLDNKPILERTYNRLLYQEIERTNNIDNIVIKVIEKLKDEEKVSDDPVNKDWSKRFFNIAENISDDYMQELWSRVLAGEIKQPNSFSLRTLETLKNISKEEAELFVKISKFLFYSVDKEYCLFNNMTLFGKYDVKFLDILKLMDAGLFISIERLSISISENMIAISNNNYAFQIKSINSIHAFDINNPINNSQIPIYKVSEAGKEILKLVDEKCSNNDFFIDNIKYIKKNYRNVELILREVERIDFENGLIHTKNNNLINSI
ncbi:DUF2806 domain-containing protein [Brachyspira pilosicoli]|uniref:DUF2806 domain-containing protein n=1 Tax=Brachyspira pilosicoli TaxID=52584 RepID=UPI001C66741C|nr:DUF2806 domain-containing protein [Brachyspira pilosicoli]MBW5399576.1 DUF2806 domain-containing protein [Brachyspira pilosicoli]